MHIVLKRYGPSPFGVFGTVDMMHKDGFVEESFFSVECPWENNAPFLSCIPEGDYTLYPAESPSKGLQYHIGTATRTNCMFHVANKASELEGCIGLGVDLGILDSEWSVTNSRKAIDLFNKTLDEDGDGSLPHTLNISWMGKGIR